jgi:hypothetical protein
MLPLISLGVTNDTMACYETSLRRTDEANGFDVSSVFSLSEFSLFFNSIAIFFENNPCLFLDKITDIIQRLL